MRKTSRALAGLFASILVTLFWAGNAPCQKLSDYVLDINDCDIWVRVIVTEKYDSSYNGTSDRQEHSEEHDRFSVTVEGTYKFKRYELPTLPTWPSMPGTPSVSVYPKTALLVEDSKDLSISGFGEGNYYSRWLSESCDPVYWAPCKDFLQEAIYVWQYATVDPVYKEDLIDGLEITQAHEKAPVRYKIEISGLFDEHFSDYINCSGTETRVLRQWTGTITDTVESGTYGPAAAVSAWYDWLGTEEGGYVEGELKFQGDQFTASGHIRHTYTYQEGGTTTTGAVEIFYRVNPKPGVKKIQVNQALGRYEYVDDEHYVPASDFVAGKDTAIQVFFDKAVPVNELSGVTLEIARDGSPVVTLTDFTRDTENNALVFRPMNRGECDNWQAGTYKFVAKTKDADETLDHVLFRERRELKILAVPVRTKFLGLVETPGNQWQSGHKYLRQVYPVAYDKVTWTRGPLFDATTEDCNTLTATGERKLWEELNKMGDGYDLVIGFVESRIPVKRGVQIRKIQGYAYLDGKASVVVNSDEDMQATVPHEVAHLFKVGDTYNGGSYHFSVNGPPLGYAGTDWDSGDPVIASDPDVKPFPGGGTGTLISQKLHPYDPQARGLLKDMMCFMGSGTAQSNYWVTPEVWRRLFWSLAATESSTSGSASKTVSLRTIRTMAATAADRYIEASGWVNQSDAVEASLPWNTKTTTDLVDVVAGDYTIQALDATGTALAYQGFTPRFVSLSNPPENLEAAPFSRVMVPFPDGTVKFRIVDQTGGVRGEVPVTAHAPIIAVTAPSAGQEIAGLYTIAWTASDPDGGQIFYRVQYSPDGLRWIDLPPSVTVTSFAADFSLLPGGSQARIRVTASDGINSKTAVSGVFRVALKGMEVSIDSPANETVQQSAGGILFQGSAYDPQEGEILDDRRLVWTSDREGEIGRGATLLVSRGLSVGQHVITFTATNSRGETASRSVTLAVTP